MTSRLVDLSHDIVSGRPGYPGLPVPRVEAWRSHAASRADYGGQAEFEITRLFMVGNTGTYLDSPRHRYRGAPDIASLPLSTLAALDAVCVVATPDPERDGAIGIEVPPHGWGGRAVLLRTGWSDRWGSDAYWLGAPFVDGSLAERLLAAGVRLVGIDGPNVDDVRDLTRPAHTRLLAAGVPIVEHLRGLDALPLDGFRFFAVPAPIRGATTLPVRAFAEVPTTERPTTELPKASTGGF